MTIEKWNEKAAGILEKLCNENNIKYYNRDNGVVFCDNCGVWAMFIPGRVILSAAGKKNAASVLNSEWENALNDDGFIALSYVSGKFGGKNEKIRSFTSLDGVTAYCKEKYLRLFPQNTLFYVAAADRPVVCGIWEGKKLHVIGLVMPVLQAGREFIPDSK